MINFFGYLDTQRSEDKRSFIIHFPAITGKTTFAKKAASLLPDIHYLDLQKLFVSTKDFPLLKECGVDFLKNFLINLGSPEDVVLIDNPDFLLNTWSTSQKKSFIQWIKLQLRSPSITNKTFIFMIQSDDVLTNANFNNSHGQPRVLALNEFEAL
jgi:hypothetical protein